MSNPVTGHLSLRIFLQKSVQITKPPRVNVLLDNDALEDSIKICEFLTKHDIPVKLVQLDGKDPNVIGFEKTWQMIDATDTVDFERLFKLKITI